MCPLKHVTLLLLKFARILCTVVRIAELSFSSFKIGRMLDLSRDDRVC